MTELYEKLARVLTELQPHQERLVEKLRASGGVVADWGLGTGKTLGSIAAKDGLDVPADVVVPAPLQENYRKELRKHLGFLPEDVRIRSYERAAKDGDIRHDGLAVFDEAHRGRNAGTGPARLMNQARDAQYRLFLTGTPVYNSPGDLAPLINAAAGRKVLPDDPALFKQTFVGQTVEEAPLLDRLKGRVLGHPINMDPRPTLINRERLIQATRGYVDFHRGGGKGFPDRIDEEHLVDMSPKQKELYAFAEGKMPWYLRAKIRSGLPMNKQESKELNAFQGALRQISNTPRGFTGDVHDENEAEHSPKIQKVVDHLIKAREENPNHRGVIYSNYLESGVHPVSRALTKAGVPHSVFTGEVTGPKRAQMVNDYNSGKTPVLLVSGAGSEGLDLKGTRTIQLVEPHWHDQRPAQVIGRGIRYLSHEHLPENERNVRVMRYYSTLPTEMDDHLGKLIGLKPKQSIEQYLKHMSGEKTHLTDQIADALQEASDYGPLQKRSASPDELFAAVIQHLGDAQVVRHKRDKYIEFDHPAGLKLRSAYNPHFIAEQVRDQYENDPRAFADQIRDDLLNMGYATLGGITAKNQKLQKVRATQGAAYGVLAGTILASAAAPLAAGAAGLGLHRAGVESRAANALIPLGAYLTPAIGLPVALGTAGFQIGKHTYKPLGNEDVIAKNTHPMLVPPKPIKAKVKLELKEK